MTVTTEILVQRFAANGVSRTFSFPIQFYEPSDLMVELVAADGTVTDGVLDGLGPAGYVVLGLPDLATGEYRAGGSVLFNSPPAAGTQVIILRNLPLIQPLDLQRGSKFPANAINAAFDRCIMIDQQLDERLGRALIYPIEGGAYDAHGHQIANVGTPTHPEDAVTKSYVDNGGWLGAIQGNQFVDGIFIDTRGTGTPDDTAIWVQALADAESLGYRKIYARRSSRVKNLNITNPVQIIGTGGFTFSLPDTAGTADNVLVVKASDVILRDFSIYMPPWNWHGTDSLPAGSGGTIPIGHWGILIRSASGSTPPYGRILIDHVHVTGGNNGGIGVYGGHDIIIRDCTCKYGGFGIALGNYPTRHIRIENFIGVACPGMAIACAQVASGNSDQIDPAMAEIFCYNVVAINCGKLSYYNGFDGSPGGAKAGFDFATSAVNRVVIRGSAHGCMGCAIEIKFTLPPPGSVSEPVLKDFDVYLDGVFDAVQGNAAVLLNNEQGNNQTQFKRVRVGGNFTYEGPTAWIAGKYYEVGTAIKVGANVYLCAGTTDCVAGYAGAGPAPTGTGKQLSCYFDGGLYWTYLASDTGGVPTALMAGLSIGPICDATNNILIDNVFVHNMSHFALLIGSTDDGATLTQTNNLIFRNCVGRELATSGILDAGNPHGGNPKTVNLMLDNCDFEAKTPLQLGYTGANGPSSVICDIHGGRFVSNSTTGGNAIYLGGGTVTLNIYGDAYFESNNAGRNCVVGLAGGTYNINVTDAAFNQLGLNAACLQNNGNMTWRNLGSVKMLMADNAQYAWLNGGTTSFQGQVIRGLVSADPTGFVAGNISERLKLAAPTATVSAYDRTTAGSAAGGVWTAKA